MLTIEKDKDAEQIFIHGTPEKLRWLASKLEQIAEIAEQSGDSHNHFMTPDWGGNELTTEIQGEEESYALINHLTVYGWRK